MLNVANLINCIQTLNNDEIKQKYKYTPSEDEYLERLTNLDNLYKAYQKMRKTNGWKTTSQKFGLNIIKNISIMKQDILKKKYTLDKGSQFNLNEGGKIRVVKTLKFKDMLFQHVLVDYILLPELQKYIMYDNGACLKGKGISFTRKRFEQSIRIFFKKHKRHGYILFLDFRRYFDNIDHEKMKQFYHDKLNNEYIDFYLDKIFKHYEVDMSFYGEYDINDIFNSVEHEKLTRDYNADTPLYMPKSMGVGSITIYFIIIKTCFIPHFSM